MKLADTKRVLAEHISCKIKKLKQNKQYLQLKKRRQVQKLLSLILDDVLKSNITDEEIETLICNQSLFPFHVLYSQEKEYRVKELEEENLTSNNSIMDSSLHSLFKSHNGNLTTKWEQYLSIYDRLLSKFVLTNTPVSILEVGILHGGFLEILEQYLPHGSKITGIDIHNIPLNISPSIEVIFKDVSDKHTANALLTDRTYDIIIDDASHICEQVIRCFENLFSKLKNGGLYIIEDCHTSYWKENYGGGYKNPTSTIEYFKNFADIVNMTYFESSDLTSDPVRKLSQEVAAVSFFDSIIVIEKYANIKQVPFRNLVAGETTPVPIYTKELFLKTGAEAVTNKTVFCKYYSK